MDWFTTELLAAMKVLLPGFLAGTCFRSLTKSGRPEPFDRVVEALIFSVMIRSAVWILESIFLYVGQFWQWGTWTNDTESFWLFGAALLLGIICAAFVHNDALHWILRKLHVTNRNSYPSEWVAVLSTHKNYVILNLKDGRRLQGWPEQWPDDPGSGHWCIVEAAWVLDTCQEIQIPQVKSMLIPAIMVEYVEFLYYPRELAGKNSIIRESEIALCALSGVSVNGIEQTTPESDGQSPAGPSGP